MARSATIPEAAEPAATPRRPRFADRTGRGLALAASPIFLVMALVTGLQEAGLRDGLCSAAPGAAFLTGMVPMYLLMAGLHASPWLALATGRGRPADEAWP